MSVTIQQHNVCYHYHLPMAQYEVLSPVARELVGVHQHLAGIEYNDLYLVSQIESEPNGMWRLLSTTPFRSLDEMKYEFKYDKGRLLSFFRQEVESGDLVAVNRCSPVRIERTFAHIMFNQKVGMYLPERDGMVK